MLKFIVINFNFWFHKKEINICAFTLDISQYDLYTRYHMNRSQLNRLKHDKNVEVNTIDKLCNILDCEVEDIMTHYPDDNVF